MPFLPPAIPANLPSLLSSLRSPIFQTQHNPLSLRLGTKYLRRRLRGPSMLTYYPEVPCLRRFNLQNPHNKFANWQGLKPAILPASGKGEGGRAWKAKALMGKEVIEEGFEEMIRVKGAGWLWDEKEDARVTKVARRRRIGKGPPKKGQWTVSTAHLWRCPFRTPADELQVKGGRRRCGGRGDEEKADVECLSRIREDWALTDRRGIRRAGRPESLVKRCISLPGHKTDPHSITDGT